MSSRSGPNGPATSPPMLLSTPGPFGSRQLLAELVSVRRLGFEAARAAGGLLSLLFQLVQRINRV
jgi:hypothetical protein